MTTGNNSDPFGFADAGFAVRCAPSIGLHTYDATDRCVACGEKRAPRLNIEKHEDAMVYMGVRNPGIAPPPESPADRILRVARQLGYAPDGVHQDSCDNGDVEIRFGGNSVIVDSKATMDGVRFMLEKYGPANQPAPKAEPAQLPPLDFVAPRDATVERTTKYSDGRPWAVIRVSRGDRVKFYKFGSGNEWTLSPGAWRVLSADLPRVHAELRALAEEARRGETETETPTAPELAHDAKPEVARCEDCHAETTRLVGGAGVCGYCFQRTVVSVHVEGSGGIAEMVDRREVDGRGAAFSTPTWEEP